MKQWEELSREIGQESDPKILHKEYHLQDNFVFLLTLEDSQRESLERMLESYPRIDYFEEHYEMFRQKGYWVGETDIRYCPRRCPGFVEWFELDCGQTSDSNAAISFHPMGNDYAKQILLGKQAVIEISKKLMEFGIHFESARPASRYTPNQKTS